MKCETNLKDGMKKIRETRTPGMVIIHKSTCAACQNLKPKLLASKDIDRLSKCFTVISLMDEDETNERKWLPDGKYFPRILFLDTSGRIMTEIMNPDRNPRFKYYYASERSLIRSMERVLKICTNSEGNSKSGRECYATNNVLDIMRLDSNLNQGLMRMRVTQQPGMIVIYKTWCPVCKELNSVMNSSQVIDQLSRYIVIVLLKDEDEPKSQAFAPDGDYIPRVLFTTPTGQIMYNVTNTAGDPRYKYFYTTESELVVNIRKVISYFPK